MQPERIMAIVLRQWYLISGSGMTRILPMFIWFGIDIVLWGFLTRYLNQIATAGDYTPVFLGAILMWDFLIRVMQGTTMAFMEDTWARNFLNLFSTPITIYEYLVGLVCSSIATSCVVLAFMLVLAVSVFGLSLGGYGWMLAPYLFALFLFGIALGIVGCAIMLRLGPAAEWFIWPIPAIISPFACVFYPKNVLPHWMQAVSSVLPPPYVFESMRSVIHSGNADLMGLGISIGLSLFYILLACWGFSCVYHYALRAGLIARYSAETVG